jgi:hypothetical protein
MLLLLGMIYLWSGVSMMLLLPHCWLQLREREREGERERERGGGGCECRYAICHQINLRDSLYQMKYIDDGGQL